MRAISFQRFAIKSDVGYDSGSHTSIEPAPRLGTGNFNIALVKEQNPNMDFGVVLLAGREERRRAGIDLKVAGAGECCLG